MSFFKYLAIFMAKVVENALSTLRLIVVAKGKKVLGAILQFIIAFVWVITTGIVVTNVKNDPLKIVFFALGSLIGSYIGSVIEEKIALGNDLITVICSLENSEKLIKQLNKQNYSVNKIETINNDKILNMLFIINKKKKRKDIIDIINKISSDSIITIESVKDMTNNNLNK